MMLRILDKDYSDLQPTQPKKNAVAVFSVEGAALAFNHSLIEFVIVLNEKTGNFAACKSIAEVEMFLEVKDIDRLREYDWCSIDPFPDSMKIKD